MSKASQIIVVFLFSFLMGEALASPIGGQSTYVFPKKLQGKSPSCIFKSTQAEFWYCFDNFLVKRNGEEYTYIDWPDDIADNSELTEIIEYRQNILISKKTFLFQFDPQKNVLIPFHIQYEFDSSILAIHNDTNQNLWVLTLDSVYLLAQNSQQFYKSVLPNAIVPSDIPTPIFSSIIQQSSNQYLIGTLFSGLVHVQTNGNQYRFVITNKDEKLQPPPDKNIYSINKIGINKYIVGTDTGIFQFDANTKSFTRLFEQEIPAAVGKIMTYSSEQVLIAAEGNGLFLLKTDSMALDKIEFEPGQNYNLKSLYVDDEQNVWIGIEGLGMTYLSKSFELAKEVSSPVNQIEKLFKASESEFIITSLNGAYFSNGRLLSPHPIFSITRTDNYWWLGSTNTIFKKNGSEEVPFQTVESTSNRIKSILVTEDTIWYVPSFGKIKKIHTNSTLSMPKIEELIPEDIAYSIIEMALSPDNSSIFIVASRSLYELSLENYTIQQIHSFDHEIISVQVLDNSLHLFFDQKIFTKFHFSNNLVSTLELPITDARCVFEATIGYWIASNSGDIFYWNQGKKSKPLTNHNSAIAPIFNNKSCIQLGSNLLFTSPGGILEVASNAPFTNKVPPKILLSGPQLIHENGNLTATIERHQLPFSVNAVSSSYLSPFENKIKYRINSGAWLEVNQTHGPLTFSQLDDGQHLISIASSNNDGTWSDMQQIQLSIIPPWWVSTQAKSIYALVAILLFVTFYRFRMRRIALRNQSLERIVEERTQKLAAQNEKIELLLRSKQQELANVSHELRTPLTLVWGPLKALSNKPDKIISQQQFDIINRNCQRLLRIVDQLMLVEKFQVQMIQDKVTIDLKETIDFAFRSFLPIAQEKGLKFTLENTYSCTTQMLPDAFEKIIVNLISNALKYCDSNGTVHLKTNVANQFFELSISNDGYIDSETDGKYIFDRFYRIHDEASERKTGAGIGLSLVKQLVEFHKGKIELLSGINNTVTFIITLPICKASHQEAISASHFDSEWLRIELESMQDSFNVVPAKLSLEKDKKVQNALVIEDNPDMREFITQILTPNYNVESAPNGKTGVELAINSLPDIIICDVMMPGMSGFEVTKTLKEDERTCHIPILILTAKGDKDSKITGWKLLADEYLTKPFDQEELVVRLQSLLKNRALLTKNIGAIVHSHGSVTAKCDSLLGDADKAFLKKVDDYFERHYQDATLKTTHMVAGLYISERQLQRKMKAVTGYSPAEYLRIFRLHKSKILLSKQMRIVEVAEEVGFNTQSYFASCFKNHFHQTPKEYQLSLKT